MNPDQRESNSQEKIGTSLTSILTLLGTLFVDRANGGEQPLRSFEALGNYIRDVQNFVIILSSLVDVKPKQNQTQKSLAFTYCIKNFTQIPTVAQQALVENEANVLCTSIFIDFVVNYCAYNKQTKENMRQELLHEASHIYSRHPKEFHDLFVNCVNNYTEATKILSQFQGGATLLEDLLLNLVTSTQSSIKLLVE